MSVVVSALLAAALSGALRGDPIPVRYAQGSAHGFLVLETIEGIPIASGDATQIIHGDRVTSRVTFHFRDGSLDDEITVFSQRRVFRSISDHHIQHGPSFPKSADVLIDAVTGTITSHTENGTIRKASTRSDVSSEIGG